MRRLTTLSDLPVALLASNEGRLIFNSLLAYCPACCSVRRHLHRPVADMPGKLLHKVQVCGTVHELLTVGCTVYCRFDQQLKYKCLDLRPRAHKLLVKVMYELAGGQPVTTEATREIEVCPTLKFPATLTP